MQLQKPKSQPATFAELYSNEVSIPGSAQSFTTWVNHVGGGSFISASAMNMISQIFGAKVDRGNVDIRSSGGDFSGQGVSIQIQNTDGSGFANQYFFNGTSLREDVYSWGAGFSHFVYNSISSPSSTPLFSIGSLLDPQQDQGINIGAGTQGIQLSANFSVLDSGVGEYNAIQRPEFEKFFNSAVPFGWSEQDDTFGAYENLAYFFAPDPSFATQGNPPADLPAAIGVHVTLE
jgi:hypothetical protein